MVDGASFAAHVLRNPLASRCVAVCGPTRTLPQDRSLHEVYYLWTVAGGGLEAEFFRQGYVKPKVPIMDIEVYVAQPRCAVYPLLIGSSKWDAPASCSLTPSARSVCISVAILTADARRPCGVRALAGVAVSTTAHCQGGLVPKDSARRRRGGSDVSLCPTARLPSRPRRSESTHDAHSLSLMIREKDVDYQVGCHRPAAKHIDLIRDAQVHRVIYYGRLLAGYPYTRWAPLCNMTALIRTARLFTKRPRRTFCRCTEAASGLPCST